MYKDFNRAFFALLILSLFLFCNNFYYKQPPDIFVNLDTHESISINKLKSYKFPTEHYVILVAHTKTDKFILISIIFFMALLGYRWTKARLNEVCSSQKKK